MRSTATPSYIPGTRACLKPVIFLIVPLLHYGSLKKYVETPVIVIGLNFFAQGVLFIT
jgi:hypothetical protein